MSAEILLSEIGVNRACLRCYPEARRAPQTTLARLSIDNGIQLVSPQGVIHHSDEYGMTMCGHDATGPKWWWRL